MNELFDHEKLTVYQDAIRFAVWAGERLAGIVSMPVGLIRSTSADRVHGERAEYETDNRRLAD